MEALLMGDDSSSGESDNEVDANKATNTTAVAANAPASLAAPSPAPPAAPAPPPPAGAPVAVAPSGGGGGGAGGGGGTSQADRMAMLKSLYKSGKSSGGATSGGGNTTNPAIGTSPTVPPVNNSNAPPMQHPTQPSVQRPHQQHQLPPQQQPQPQQQVQQPQQIQQTYAQREQYGRQRQTQQPQPQQKQQQQQQQQIMNQQHRSHQGQNMPAPQQRQQSQPVQPPQQQMQRDSGSSRQIDPFAPTPLAQIKQSQEAKQRHQQQQQQSQQYRQPPQQLQHGQQQPSSSRGQPSSHHPQMQMGGGGGGGSGGGGHHNPSTSSSLRPRSSSGQSVNNNNDDDSNLTPQQKMERERARKKKEHFLSFTKVLVKYLEQKDKRLHAQARYIITDCAKKNKEKRPGYESVTESMRVRLRSLVGESYWKKATEYLYHFMKQKKEAQLAAMTPEQRADYQKKEAQLKAMTPEQRADFHMKRQQRIEQQQSLAASRQQERTPGAPAPAPTMDHLMRDIHKQREKIAKTMPGQQRAAVGPISPSTMAPPLPTTTAKVMTTKAPMMAASPTGTAATLAPTAAATTATTATAKDKNGKKQVHRKSGTGASMVGPSRKTPTGTAKDQAAIAATTATTVPNAPRTVAVSRQQPVVKEQPPREYQELMDLIENAVDYEWPSILELLGNKDDLNISKEERNLLYDTSTAPSLSTTQNQEKEGMNSCGPILSGWSRTNILSARSAWARVRLKEQRRLALEASHTAPSVADGLLTLPSASSSPHQSGSSSSGNAQSLKDVAPANIGEWVNDESAEQDKALALLSEGTQIYLKGVLEKAIQCAHQRQNLDGIRLWHQQYATLCPDTKKDDSGSSEKDLSKKPHLSLRLGCDVPRQIAQAQGNAAMTCKRMEEALERQVNIPSQARAINDETLCQASSMGEIALKPLVRTGVEKADLQAKRSFEVYGGKHAKDPPFGRVPKRGKLEVQDFLMGSRIQPENTHFHKASSASGFLSF